MKKSKMIVDMLMTVLLFILMGMHLTGQMWHEIAGAAMFVLFVVHHILNRAWIKAIPKGKYNTLRVVQMLLNASMLVCILLLMFSGMAMSGYVFKWLPLPLSTVTARKIHLITSHLAYLLMSLHIGIHFGMMIGRIGRRVLAMKKSWGGIIAWTSRVLALAAAVYGLLALFGRKFFSYIF